MAKSQRKRATGESSAAGCVAGDIVERTSGINGDALTNGNGGVYSSPASVCDSFQSAAKCGNVKAACERDVSIANGNGDKVMAVSKLMVYQYELMAAAFFMYSSSVMAAMSSAACY